MKRLSTIPLALCALLVSSLIPFESFAATTLSLKNGDRITGEILTENPDGSIRFKMDVGPEITLPAESLKAEMLKKDMSASKQAAPQKQVSAETLAKVEPAAPAKNVPFSWGGRVEFGGELQTGNSDTESIAFDSRLKAREGQNRYQGDFDFDRSEEEGEITEDSWELAFGYERFQSLHWFLGADAGFRNDDVAELDLRTRLGVNSGYQFYDRSDLSLKASGGLAYLNENFANQSTDTSIALTQALEYEQGFNDEMVKLFYEHDLLAPTDGFDAFIFNAETGVRVPVAEKFIGTAGIDFDWDNDPADGVSEEDVTYTLKLGYEF